MTVSVSDSDNINGDENDIRDTINFIMEQPNESLEMFQNSFLVTKPSVPHSFNNSGIIKSLVHTNGQNQSSSNKSLHSNDTGIQQEMIPEIHLGSGNIVSSVLYRTEWEKEIPLPKVDNFVDNENTEDNYWSPGDIHSDDINTPNTVSGLIDGISTVAMEIGQHNADIEEQNKSSTESIDEGLLQVKVKFLPPMTDDADVPGVLGNKASESLLQSQWSCKEEIDSIGRNNKGHIILNNCNIDVNEQSLDSGSEATDGSCVDKVVPFKLDDNFDYDNVKLTPKFQIDEN